METSLLSIKKMDEMINAINRFTDVVQEVLSERAEPQTFLTKSQYMERFGVGKTVAQEIFNNLEYAEKNWIVSIKGFGKTREIKRFNLTKYMNDNMGKDVLPPNKRIRS
jgi:predicted AAA+ superfamily ATPase